MSDVDRIIADLRALVAAETDSELAKALKIDKSTISSWRSRGRVPSKFVAYLEEGNGNARSELLSQDEMLPMFAEMTVGIAAFRLALVMDSGHPMVADQDALTLFLQERLPFFALQHRAVLDVRDRVIALGVKPETARLLVIQADLSDRKAALSRTLEHLEEDLRDNEGALGYRITD